MIFGRMKQAIRRIPRAARSEVHAMWRARSVRDDVVLYESFAGNGALCNPEAIFRYLLDHADFAHLSHIWVLDNNPAYAEFRREFRSHPRVSFVTRESIGYWKALATSKYLINNATFPPDFSKRPGQVYLNTWHGTPLKRMGFDMPNGALESANTLRNFLAADFLVSANAHMTRTMYAEAYKLDGIYRGRIIEAGYPRIDRTFLSDVERSDVEAQLAADGIHLDGRKLAVFAPTWRGASFSRPADNLTEIMAQRARLASRLDPAQWLVVVKLHQQAHRFSRGRADMQGLLVPNGIPTNALLGLTDMLITDFSSIFFDYLPLERPLVFFAPDAKDYESSRGLYFDQSDLPAPVFTSLASATKEVSRLSRGLTAEDKARLRRGRARFCRDEDGNATARVVDVVFRGRTRGTHTFTNSKPRVLLHIGGMRPNGITSSALNLLNEISTDAIDVTVTYPAGKAAQSLFRTHTINPAVRQLPRVGGMNGSKARHLRRHLRHFSTHVREELDEPWEAELWNDEWIRCFGDARFDSLVDFSGYSPFWALLFLHAPSGSHSIWLHNDMWADAHRTVGGRQFLRRNLMSLFTLYKFFDHLVSVSPALAEVNRNNLITYAPSELFTYATNCIDGATIAQLAGVPIAGPDDSSDNRPDLRWLNRRSTTRGPVFVNIGRLSPEKNQARLIRAFAQVHSECPEARLVIVGDGPLKDELTALVGSLGLRDVVTMAGQRPNPFAILRRSDCFVMSSDYEGQPMVLLESAVLGVPSISVAFGSVASALPEGAITITEQDDEDLATAMIAFVRSPRRGYRLNAAAYNRRAVHEFLRAVGLRAGR